MTVLLCIYICSCRQDVPKENVVLIHIENANAHVCEILYRMTDFLVLFSTGVQETGRHPNQIRILDAPRQRTFIDVFHTSGNKTVARVFLCHIPRTVHVNIWPSVLQAPSTKCPFGVQMPLWRQRPAVHWRGGVHCSSGLFIVSGVQCSEGLVLVQAARR